MPDIFQITLRDTSGFEHFDHREFDVPVGSSFPIGRASKNTTKKDLMPAVHNAYIDSPVISREHAVLSVPSTDVPHVFITDVASMHGTIVNGEKLTPHAKTQLSPGDLLQFGVDVNRNEEYFTARKYTFEAHFKRAQAPFSMGFTVPDSEGEEIGGTTPPRGGSQDNPLTINESDSDSDASDNEPIDLTDDCLIQIDDETVAVVDLHSRDNSDPTPVDDILIAQEIFSDNEGGTGYYSSDQQEDELDLNLDSGASHMDESDIDYNSDLQVSDMEDEDINETHVHQADPDRRCPPIIHSESTIMPLSGQSSYPIQDFLVANSNAGLFPPMNVHRQTWDNNVYSNAFPPPLPPRPSAPSMFDRSDLPPTSNHSWFSDMMPPAPSFLGPNQGDRPMLFDQTPALPMLPNQESSVSEASPLLYLQTPPPPPPMSNSDVTPSTPPPPSRRTKVSITEIVEDQPPTPTSINSMKRKAEVLEDDEAVIEEQVITHHDVFAPPTVTESAVQTVAEIAQRPKLQPRSVISKVRSTATYIGYSAVGAVSAVALLSYLPDAFFA